MIGLPKAKENSCRWCRHSGNGQQVTVIHRSLEQFSPNLLDILLPVREGDLPGRDTKPRYRSGALGIGGRESRRD